MSEITLSLPDDIAALLDRRARATGTTVEALATGALRRLAAGPRSHATPLWLSAPITALVEGIYHENTTIADVRAHGDLGLGTFNDLDGEMVVLDGQVYQLRADGQCYRVADDQGTPFAAVTFFAPDSTETLDTPHDHDELMALLHNMTPSANMVYAIRIEGRFRHVKVRSVPRQDCYRPLVEVAREQPEFDYTDIDGVLCGFWTPAFMSSLSVPGFHLHFLSADRAHGGHLMTCDTESVTVGLQHLPRVELDLPVTLDYLTADFTRDLEADLKEAE